MSCDYPPPCDELIARVAQSADELTPAPDPARGQYYHGIRQVANHLNPKPKPDPKANPKPKPNPKSEPKPKPKPKPDPNRCQVANYRANNGTLCLGPLNQVRLRARVRV